MGSSKIVTFLTTLFVHSFLSFLGIQFKSRNNEATDLRTHLPALYTSATGNNKPAGKSTVLGNGSEVLSHATAAVGL